MKQNAVIALVSVCIGFIVFEIGLRTFFALRVGPDILLYGIMPTYEQVEAERHTVGKHHNQQLGYTKYFPNQARVDHDKETGELFNVRINSRGFRGDEFDNLKAPDVIRVATLGASSTFGYYDRDNETYPFYLEERLNEHTECAATFEVINFGIPHLVSAQILALFRAEVLAVRPDVVTFYEGINDASASPTSIKGIKQTRELPTLRSLYRLARGRLLLVKYFDEAYRHSEVSKKYSAQLIDDTTKPKIEKFLRNIEEIYRGTRSQGAVFIAISQQAQAGTFERSERKGITYAREVEFLREKLAMEGSLRWVEHAFLHHAALMSALEDWSKSQRIPFVDGIAALDQDRDVLLSWVHLSPKGNRIIADAIATEIVQHLCK